MLAPWGTSYPGRCASETAPPGLLSPWCSRSDGPHRSVQTAGWCPTRNPRCAFPRQVGHLPLPGRRVACLTWTDYKGCRGAVQPHLWGRPRVPYRMSSPSIRHIESMPSGATSHERRLELYFSSRTALVGAEHLGSCGTRIALPLSQPCQLAIDPRLDPRAAEPLRPTTHLISHHSKDIGSHEIRNARQLLS